MNLDALKSYLDGLIAQTRAGFNSVDGAMHEIAGALHRYGVAEQEIVAIGDMLRSMRQPLPQPMQQHGQPLPPLPAEDDVQAEWDRIRQQTPRVNGQHG